MKTHMYITMVVLTVVTTSNPYTLYFDHAIQNPSYIRLLSASFYNSWHNLKDRGEISFFDSQDTASVKILPPGHYTVNDIVRELEGLSEKEDAGLEFQTNTPVGQIVIYNKKNKKIVLDRDLSALLGISRKLLLITYVKQLQQPSTYFIHCDLVDQEQNLLNGKPSTVLARCDVRGKAFEKVNYQLSHPHVLRDVSAGEFVNDITLSVRDENNELFDFKGQPWEFEVELN